MITKYIITSPESEVLPSDIAMRIYGSQHNINVKETCFGIIINGEQEEVADLIKEIRAMDPTGIFIKDRGFPPGDLRRCRGHRGGGARPGYYMIESESKLLPLISRALASEEKASPGPRETETIQKKRPISIKKLDEIVKEEIS
jgi:putative methanogenesis marker protein 6